MLRKIYIIAILLSIYFPLFSQFDFCVNNISQDIIEYNKCLIKNKSFTKEHKIKSIRIYKTKYNEYGIWDTLLSDEYHYDNMGNPLNYKKYYINFNKPESTLNLEETISYNNLGKPIQIEKKFYDERFTTSEHSCYHHQFVLWKLKYTNGKLSRILAFYPNQKLARDYSLKYLDSGKVVKIFNNSSNKLIRYSKYNTNWQLIEDIDYSFEYTKQTKYQYDSLNNLTRITHIFQSGAMPIERIYYQYDSSGLLIEKKELNIYKRPSRIFSYTYSDSITIETCEHYDITGRNMSYVSKKHIDLNGNILYSDISGEHIFEYDKRGLIINSKEKIYSNGSYVYNTYVYYFY